MSEYKQTATCMFLSVIPYLYTLFYSYDLREITIYIITAMLVVLMCFHLNFDIRRKKWYTHTCYAIIVFGNILNIHFLVETLLFYLEDHKNLLKLATMLCKCFFVSIYTILPFFCVVYLLLYMQHDTYIHKNIYTALSFLIVSLLAHAYAYSFVTNSFLRGLLLLIFFYTFLGCILSTLAEQIETRQYCCLKIAACVFF